MLKFPGPETAFRLTLTPVISYEHNGVSRRHEHMEQLSNRLLVCNQSITEKQTA